SWIGGDRDGNPAVTSGVTYKTLQLQRALVLQKYEQLLRDLMRRLSFSATIVNITDELRESIEQDRRNVRLTTVEPGTNESEPYRIKLTYMLQKHHNMQNES